MTVQDILAALAISADEETAGKIVAYHGRIMEMNAHINLTGIKDTEESLVKNVYDSLTAYDPAYFPEGGRVLDLGTGAGFPGAVLAALRQDMQFVLMDSIQKKLRCVETAAEEAALRERRGRLPRHERPRRGRRARRGGKDPRADAYGSGGEKNAPPPHWGRTDDPRPQEARPRAEDLPPESGHGGKISDPVSGEIKKQAAGRILAARGCSCYNTGVEKARANISYRIKKGQAATCPFFLFIFCRRKQGDCLRHIRSARDVLAARGRS